MNTTVVQLPTNAGPTDATLYYERDYSKGGHRLDFLHLIKEGLFFNAAQPFDPDGLEEAYWADLDKYRHQFAAAIPGAYDLLVDPPSTSGYHRPYLSAFKQRHPNLQWVYFWKNKPVKADINNMDELRKEVVYAAQRSKGSYKGIPAPKCQRIIIVDDVYASGVTAAVIVEKLWGLGVPKTAEITIACPLRVPLQMQGQKLEVVNPEDLPQ